MHDGMPYGRIQGQGQGHEPIQGSRIENLQSREVDRQSPTGLILIQYRRVTDRHPASQPASQPRRRIIYCAYYVSRVKTHARNKLT